MKDVKRCLKIIDKLIDLLETKETTLESVVGFEIPDPEWDDILDQERALYEDVGLQVYQR